MEISADLLYPVGYEESVLSGDCWVEVSVDGVNVPRYGHVAPGKTVTLKMVSNDAAYIFSYLNIVENDKTFLLSLFYNDELYTKDFIDLFLSCLDKIVEVENIEVSEEEIEAEMQKYADMYKLELDVIKNAIPADEVKGDLAAEKAMQLVKDNCKA